MRKIMLSNPILGLVVLLLSIWIIVAAFIGLPGVIETAENRGGPVWHMVPLAYAVTFLGLAGLVAGSGARRVFPPAPAAATIEGEV